MAAAAGRSDELGADESATVGSDQDATRAADAADSESDQSSMDDERVAEFQHTESIYSFMVIYPELLRMKQGTYWTWHVWWALLLFTLNVTLQVSLTYITGYWILQDAFAYRVKLLGDYYGDHETEFLQSKAIQQRWDDLLHVEQPGCCRGPWCPQRNSLGVSACCAPGVFPSQSAVKQPGEVTFAALRGKTRRNTRLQQEPRWMMPGIVNESTLESFLGKPAAKSKKQQKDGGESSAPNQGAAALCQHRDGKLDCSQPTFSVLDYWGQLDYDGDGVWTREEAVQDYNNLACVMNKGISMEQIFLKLVYGLEKHFDQLADRWGISVPKVPASVHARTAVPRYFFEVWSGVVVLCSVRDAGRCGQLIEDGVFNGPLSWPSMRYGDGFAYLMDAMDFCQTVLEHGDICEDSHPVTFPMWSQLAGDMCGKGRATRTARFENQFKDGDHIEFTEFTYKNIETYTKAGSLTYQFFVSLILFLWFASLLGELNSMLLLADFAYNFPHAEGDPFNFPKLWRSIQYDVGKVMSNKPVDMVTAASYFTHTADDTTTITGITHVHRLLCYSMVIVRALLLCYMAAAGVAFLITTYVYTDLLMNAVALAFVFELPEFLFVVLVGQAQQQECRNVQPLLHRTSLPDDRGVRGMLKSNNFWGLVLIPLMIFSIVHWNQVVNTGPILEALNCACLGAGPRCSVGGKLSQHWWDNYWLDMRTSS